MLVTLDRRWKYLCWFHIRCASGMAPVVRRVGGSTLPTKGNRDWPKKA
jgi:hypothetical protein